MLAGSARSHCYPPARELIPDVPETQNGSLGQAMAATQMSVSPTPTLRAAKFLGGEDGRSDRHRRRVTGPETEGNAATRSSRM